MRTIHLIILIVAGFVLLSGTDSKAFGKEHVSKICLAPKSMALHVSDPDLMGLSSPKAKRLGRVLKSLLDAVEFDRINQSVRSESLRDYILSVQSFPRGIYSGDYQSEPFPDPGSIISIGLVRKLIDDAVVNRPPDLRVTPRQQKAFYFFMFGDSLTREEMLLVLGKEHAPLLQDFLDIGLFVLDTEGRIRMNGLSLFSRVLRNGKVLYGFVDTPIYLDDSIDRERVYIGPDSYQLQNRLSAFRRVSGTVAETGTGSGIQLITACLLFPGIQQAIGLEIDRRAIQVSRFNAVLNGVDRKISVYQNPEAFSRALKNRPVSLALSNPPFMHIPSQIQVLPDHVPLIPEYVSVDLTGSLPKIDLRDMSVKAGWGGADGLAVTREFLELLLPAIEPGGTLILFSQFAGNAVGPTRIFELAQTHGNVRVRFEPIPGYAPFDVAFWSDMIVHLLLQQNPDLNSRPKGPLLSMLEQFRKEILSAYQSRGITHIHSGTFRIVKSGRNAIWKSWVSSLQSLLRSS